MNYAVCKPGPGCSKLTTSLVNVSLKFQMLISYIHQYFWLKNLLKFQMLISYIHKYFLLKKCEKLLHCKASLIFSTKISVFLVI